MARMAWDPQTEPANPRVTPKKTINPTQTTPARPLDPANPSQGTPAVWDPKTASEEV